MRTIAIIQARSNSKRFPNKIVQDLGDQTLLTHVVKAATSCPSIDKTYIAMPESTSDGMKQWFDISCRHYFDMEMYYHPGDENDVLGRFIAILEEDPADIVVRLTADNPCIKPCQIERLIEYVNNSTFAIKAASDLYIEVLSREALEYINKDVRIKVWHDQVYYREHVTSLMDERGEITKFPWWSIDYENDLKRMEEILAGRCTLEGKCIGADWSGPGCEYIRNCIGC